MTFTASGLWVNAQVGNGVRGLLSVCFFDEKGIFTCTMTVMTQTKVTFSRSQLQDLRTRKNKLFVVVGAASGGNGDQRDPADYNIIWNAYLDTISPMGTSITSLSDNE